MRFLDDVKREPWAHHFYAVLRELERNTPGKPRIGESATRSEDVVLLSQEPFTTFAPANLTAVNAAVDGTPRISMRFLGMFGPNGPLPLHMTETALIWALRDPAFVRFAEILSTRFLQLFFRSWANARALAQFERIEEDRFQVYLGSFAGTGTPVLKGDRDGSADKKTLNLRRLVQRLAFSGLANSHVKSAKRLEQMIRQIFRLDVEVSEWAGTWLSLQADERTSLGRQSAGLGKDLILGGRVYSISDRFRLRIRSRSVAEYESLLPGAGLSRELEALIFFYCGYRYEFEFQPGLEKKQAPSLQLGKSGRLGLTAWMVGEHGHDGDGFLWDARFDPQRRNAAASKQQSDRDQQGVP